MELNKENIKKICLIVFGAIAFYCLLEHFDIVISVVRGFFGLVFPFILGLAIAFIINVPMSAIEKKLFGNTGKKVARIVSLVITIMLIFGVVIAVMVIVLPELFNTIVSIGKQIPNAWGKLIIAVENSSFDLSILDKYLKDIDKVWNEVSDTVIGAVKNGAIGVLSTGVGVVGGVISAIGNFVIGFVFAIYVLLQKEELTRNIKRVLRLIIPRKRAKSILGIASLTYKTFASFLTGQCLEACILGTMFFVTMSIMQIPYALLIGILIAITALIPIVGAFIGCFVGLILIVMVSPIKALFFLILFLILQQIEGNLIYPHVVGGSVGLPSIWVLVAVTVGGNLMGITGMILFIPIFSVIYSIFRYYINTKEKMKRYYR